MNLTVNLRHRRGLRVVLSAFLYLAGASFTLACTTPVFTYAMRRWPTDPHVMATARKGADLAKLEEGIAKLDVSLVVTAADEKSPSGLYFPNERSPWLQGEVEDERLPSLTDSPQRRELVRRLLAGDSIVWLHVPAEDQEAAAVEAQEKALAARLEFLRGVVELPTIDPEDPSTQRTLALPGPPIRLAFSIQRIDSKDEKEWALVRQLRMLGSTTNEPVKGALIVPVYGRARALAAFPPPPETPNRTIDEVVFFLTGACSCQIKELNPGHDVLLKANWDRLLEEIPDPASQSAGADKAAAAQPPAAPPEASVADKKAAGPAS